MNCKIQKSKLNGRITCPSNKSYTHRAIFLAALSDGKSIVKKILRSNDTMSTINACRGFGWEGVGLCSYFLIGFWFKKESANKAAIKAFVVNRVGDFGFALGIFLIF